MIEQKIQLTCYKGD